MLIFVATEQKLHVSTGERNAHVILACARLVKSNTIFPSVEYSTGEEYIQAMGPVQV